MAKVQRIVVQIPGTLKEQLDEERNQGRSTAWVVRQALGQYFSQAAEPKKTRKRLLKKSVVKSVVK